MPPLPPRFQVVRWGRSPYEQGSALEAECRRVQALGLGCRHLPGDAPAEALSDAHVLVVTSTRPVEATDLRHLPSLRLVVTTTSGYDHVDLDALRWRGVPLVRLPLARRDAVVESTLGMALSLLRDLPRQREEAQEGRWVRADLPARGIQRLLDLDVGVVGLGVIGTRMVQVLSVLGARVETWDPAVRLDPLKQLAPAEMVAKCRIVTLHCRSDRGAPPVLDRAVLARARPDLILLNTARGKVLDLEAAWQGLRAGRLGALGLDVFPKEPWPRLAELARHPRVVVTPHAAGYHEGLAEAIADELLSVLRAWLTDQPLPGRVV